METLGWVQDYSSTSMYSIYNRDNNYWLNYGCVTIGNSNKPMTRTVSSTR